MNKSIFLSTILLLAGHMAASQPVIPGKGYVYNDSIVPKIDILIRSDFLDQIFADPASDYEYPATFIFTTPAGSDTVPDVGFRLRGNTSRNSAKKSYKVSFNTFVPGRKFHGLEKMNINGEHNDPSIMRAKLCWDMLRYLEVPASRANHVQLYVNRVYYGLYLNVEHIDEQFVRTRFGDNHGNLYKCLWPADLVYLGDRQDSYKLLHESRRAYDLVTNKEYDDIQDLVNLIRVLSSASKGTFTCEFEKVFNISGYIKICAFDILTGNWDNYSYLKNNFYLYMNPVTGRFEFIPYDLDNTFGVDWFNVDWASRDLYQWSAEESRPLYERIMAVDEYRDLLGFYIDSLLNSYFRQDYFSGRINYLHDLIRPYVGTDPYYPLDYGYTINDFDNSPYLAAGAHVKWGLEPFVLRRTSTARDQLVVRRLIPVVSYLQHNRPDINDTLVFRAVIEDDDPGAAYLMLSRNEGEFEKLQMSDDGNHGDRDPNDGIYGIILPGTALPWKGKFYLNVTDKSGNVRDYPCEPEDITVPESPGLLAINEIMALNHSVVMDEYGEYDDWIEIFNPNPFPVWLGNKFLTDELDNRDKWKLPDQTLYPYAFRIIWADGQTEQGDFHASFRLDGLGEEVGISDSPSTGFRLIDHKAYSLQSDNISLARSADGAGQWIFTASPSPGQSNLYSVSRDEGGQPELITVYPNPTTGGKVFFNRKADFILSDIYGRALLNGNDQDELETGSLAPGLYLLRFTNNQAIRLVIE